MYSKFTLKYYFRVREITFDEIQVWSHDGRIKLSLDWCRRQFDALRSLVLTPWPLQTLIKFLKTLPLQSFLFPKNHLIKNLPSCKHSNAKRHFPSLPNKTPTPEPTNFWCWTNSLQPQTPYPPSCRHSQGPPSTLQTSQCLKTHSPRFFKSLHPYPIPHPKIVLHRIQLLQNSN